MSPLQRATAAMPLRTPVCRAVLALAAAAPLSAFAAVDADAVGAAPAFVAQELAPTVAHAGTASAPFARNTPAVVQTVTADQLADRNLVTAEDALKYQPNVMVRRRFIGDRNAIFAGRDFNEIQSARGLLYADGILLSNLLGSSYGYPPRWSMVGPDDLARVDILYGPFSALLPGNSMGTTIALTLRKPEAFEAGAQTQVMRQHYSDAYGFSHNVTGNHESASLGDRIGRLWYALSVDRLENDSQPMQYATPNSVFTGGQASVPVTGAVRDLGPGGQPRVILGAQMLERTQQLQETLRLGYAFSERLEATLTLGHWENHFADRAESFLRDATPAAAGNVVTGGNVLIGGMPYTIAQNAFAPQNGDQENWLYGLGVKGRVGDWKLDANASAYDVTRDILRASNTASAGGPGTVFYGDGTGWSNFDLKAVSPTVSGHTVTTGYHYDQYHLRNQTFNASHWPTETLSTLKSSYQGDTRTQALFAQDAWAFAPRWLATLGLRYETWRADNGRLGNAGTTLGYAGRTEDAFSPKAALQWQATQDMLLRLSYGRAVRFPTVVELFQGSISGNTIVNNDPNLKPERANDLDFTVEQAVPSGMLRASLFQSDVRDSLYTQTNITVTPNVTSVQNVDRVRTRGIEPGVFRAGRGARSGRARRGHRGQCRFHASQDAGRCRQPGLCRQGLAAHAARAGQPVRQLARERRLDPRRGATLFGAAVRHARQHRRAARGLWRHQPLLHRGSQGRLPRRQACHAGAGRRQPDRPAVLRLSPVSVPDLLWATEMASMMHPISRLTAGLLLALAATLAGAHAGHEHGGTAAQAAKPQLATTAAFDPAGRLWVSRAEGRHVVVAWSDDLGMTWSAPRRLNPQPEPIYTDGENRPKVLASPDGALYVTWSRPLEAPYTGFVRFSRSLDGGRTWSAPATVHHDRQPITHRFDSIAVDGAGRLFITWIDKRDLLRAQAAGQPYDGAAVYYTVSTDRGATFAPERKVADQTCECCRIALAPDADGRMLALWRNVFAGQIRDHALAALPVDATPPTTTRATFSDWRVEACPHHGPALAVTADGMRHMAWFSMAQGKPGLFYSRLSADGKPVGGAWAFTGAAQAGAQASHPALLSADGAIWLAWKQFADDRMQILLRKSTDGGAHWSAPASLARTDGGSDHPQLLARDRHVYLSWRTQAEGYRLIDVTDAVPPDAALEAAP